MDIKIVKSGRACSGCNGEFQHEQPLTSTLDIVEGQLVREDYCGECLQEQDADTAYSAWTSEFYDPTVADQQPAEHFSPLRSIFYECVESEDRQSIAVAYLAAQLMRRQKVFRWIKESHDPETEAAQFLFTDRIGNRLIEVNDPNLSHAELEIARGRLLEQLNAMENTEAEEGTEDGQSEDQYAEV